MYEPVLRNLSISSLPLTLPTLSPYYQVRLVKPFSHEEYLSHLSTLRDQLKVGLSAAGKQEASETLASAAELAEKIKGLRAADAVEAAPLRIGKSRSSAEEPVTARIRRRLETVLRLGQPPAAVLSAREFRTVD